MKGRLVGQQMKSFNFIGILGEGAWATVYEAIDQRDKNIVAIKAIALQLMKETPKLQQLVKTEIKVLKACRNENVIKFIDSFKSDKYIFIAMQYCNGGDLEGYLDKKNNLSEDQATTFLKQILNGFKGLHEVGAMHRDFKVANVLLHNQSCKIADLGFAKQMQKKSSLTNTTLGTSLTMAPEVLDEQPYGFEADIWSIGVVYYQLLYGRYPYNGKSDYEILKNIKGRRPDYKKVQISDNAKDFIERCLTVNPKKRIKWQEIYEHPLIRENQTFIYKLSSIRVNENKNFYKKGLDEKQAFYPDIKKQENLDVKEVKFDIIDMIQSTNINAIVKEANEKKTMEVAFEELQKLYLDRRNDIYFVFKFIIPHIQQFKEIKANHNIALFLLAKRSYLDMSVFLRQVQKKENIFKKKHFFKEFANSPIFLNFTKQVENDFDLVRAQCKMLSSEIQICSHQIRDEFQIQRTKCLNFQELVRQTAHDYWFILAENLVSINGKNKEQLIKVLEALNYYQSNSKTNVEEFDHMMTVIDLEKTEEKISSQYELLVETEH